MTEPAPTPRTDAALVSAFLESKWPNASFVHADFARTLERALVAKEAELQRRAKPEFDDLESNAPIAEPIERLRFFCSLAMKPQDWLDVEPLFVACEAELAKCRKDAEMLNWIERNLCRAGDVVNNNGVVIGIMKTW